MNNFVLDLPSSFSVNIHLKDVGKHEETGFTHNKNIEPITFREDDPHTNELPVIVAIVMRKCSENGSK